jgi:hypothetical protein
MKTKPILLALCGFALLAASGCAAPGAPQPPSLRLPVAADNLSVVRKGNRVTLIWSSPTETTDHQAMRWPTTTRICRVLNQFPVNACGEPVKEINSGELVSVAPGARRPVVSFEDVLPPASIAAQNQATYAIEVVNQRGRSAGLSNQVRVPLLPVASPPADFRAVLDAQGPLLEWSVPTIPAPSPGISYRLRIYRRAHGKTDFALAGEQPYRLGEDEARDRNFEWEQEYDYKITSVTGLAVPGRPTVEVEGDDSQLVHLTVHDVFPPAVPTGLQAVFSSVGQKPFIDLTWAPDTEDDLAGYIVYRRTAASPFTAASTSLVKAPAWRDNDVHPGQKYYYTVAAIDVRGNQSAQSAPAEESVPQEVR